MRDRLVALVVGLVASAAFVTGCGSGGEDGDRPTVSVSVSATLPERSTTVPSETTLTTATPPTAVPTTRDSILGGGPDTSTSAAPTTPTTATPTTTPPTTAAPTTAPPTTAVPTTAAPTTEPPTTTGPTTTAAPTSTTAEEATTAVPAPATGEGTEDEDATTWWPWALLALLLAVVAGVLLMRRSRRAAAALGARTDRVLTEAEELAAHLAALSPDRAQVVAAQDAARLASMGAELEAIAAEESDTVRKEAVNSVRTQVLVLHGVVDGVALTGGPPSEAALAHLAEEATVLHARAAQARASLFPPPPAPSP